MTKTTAITAAIVERVMAIARRPLPDATLRLAKQCVLDWSAVAIAGANEPLVQLMRAQASAEGGFPRATVVAHVHKMSARQAALLNGAMGHALDYDDVHSALPGHITAAVFPAALAIAETEKCSGAALLHAFVAGYEAAVMIGLYVGMAHYNRGFHATGTIGAFGAAAACAVLLGLDHESTARALGIAGTQTAGLKAQFGTMCKPLHAGKASENGLTAAQLARDGFTSRVDIIECVQGFADTQSSERHADAAIAAPRRGFHLHDNLFKYSAACYGTHGAIEAARHLRITRALNPDQIRNAQVQVEASVDRICNIAAPRTGLEAKFSLRFTTALALAGEDTSDAAVFSDANAARADLVTLRDRVTIGFSSDSPLLLSTVKVETLEGQSFVHTHDASVPNDDLDAQSARLALKFRNLVVPCVGETRGSEILKVIENLEQHDANALSSLLHGPRSGDLWKYDAAR
ncbi:MAG: MmgE/PrpD family protein [Gammaproteobacteria bacterium]|nr:MmgE/PrpD family protein [Gammaproteobacteria bacterium]